MHEFGGHRCLLAVLLLTGATNAQIQLTGPYSENFNVMGASGTTTPAGWFVGGGSADGVIDTSGNGAIFGTAVQVDNGSVPAANGTIGSYNYGNTGSTSRCLGSIATTSRGHRAMEGRFVNAMGSAISSLEIRYDGKQWRVEGGGVQALIMKYSLDGINFVDMGANFNFSSPQTGGAGTALNGDSVRVNGIGGIYTPASPIPSGATFHLRWFDFNDAGVADHGLAIDNFSLSNITLIPGGGSILTFQQGAGGYTGTVDTFLMQANPDTNFGTSTVVEWDGEDFGGQNFGLLRFENLFGEGPGQITPGDTITSATLIYNVVNTGNPASVNEVTVNWSDTDTWNTFAGEPGVPPSSYGASLGSAPGTPAGDRSLDVTSSLLAWQSAPANNRGWIFRPTGGTDGVEFRSSEAPDISLRPRLSVLINAGAPAGKTLVVKYQPYLQLGDAPLATTGPGIGQTDQIVIAWQTIEAGSGMAPNDFFEVEYRVAGEPDFTAAGPVETLDTGTETRVNHSVTITGLPWNTLHDYRVHHKRHPAEPVLVNTYTGTFKTRRELGDPGEFTFAAYGDSVRVTDAGDVARFESVMSRVTVLGAEFVTLLGDNIYDTGTHQAYDGRFDGNIVPIQSAYVRNHIEYFCDGNHDSGDPQYGLPSRQNYYCPIPVQGVTSPVPGAVGEFPEDNYSFDHGLVHFAIIDSTAWGGVTPSAAGVISQARQTNILNWLAADLAATSQPWKVVITHHPPKSLAGHPDTGEGMAAELMPVLVQHDVDLLLVGHSHNYQRSFPITGYSGGNVTWLTDESGVYTKGGQVIQVLAGTGGRQITGTAPTSATQWLAKAFAANNGGEVGPLLVEVTPAELRVKWISAATGAVRDQFVIMQPGPTITLDPETLSPTVFRGDNLPNDTFTVRNSGPDTLNYTIEVNADWLGVSPTGGVSTGEADAIEVMYDVAGLAVGQYPATITVASDDAVNSPRHVMVNLSVVTVKPDFDGDGDVDQEDFGHLQYCFSGPAVPQTNPDCFNALLDGDNDVDGDDFTIFFNCYSGPNIPADRLCAD